MAYKFGNNLEMQGKIDALSENVKIIQYGFLFLVLALTFTLGGIVMDSFAQKQASYQSLQINVQEQNTKTDALNKKIDGLTEKIEELFTQVGPV